MELRPRLADLLARAADAAPFSRQHYEELVAGMRLLGVGAAAPAVGEAFPPFALPDAQGRYHDLPSLVAGGPMVLSFNRGGWCPFCRHELTAWNEYIPALAALGARFVAITGEVGGRAAQLKLLLEGDGEVLADVDHGVALASGLAFHLGAKLIERYQEIGLDLQALYGSRSGFLPVPATFVIDRAGIVRYAFVDADFRVRAEPEEVMVAVEALCADDIRPSARA